MEAKEILGNAQFADRFETRNGCKAVYVYSQGSQHILLVKDEFGCVKERIYKEDGTDWHMCGGTTRYDIVRRC